MKLIEVRNKNVDSNSNNNKIQYKKENNQYTDQMNTFNRYKQVIETIKKLDKSRPKSWIQAIIKQARFARLQDRAERLQPKHTGNSELWADDDYHPHEH